MEITDIYPNPLPDFPVSITYAYIDQLIGKHIPAETVKSIVTSLEMRIEEETAEGLKLTVPAYRVDVQRPCDVVEDILRIYGYNNVEIPLSLNSTIAIKGDVDKSFKLQNLVSEQLVGAGFNEILNNSLSKSSYYDDLQSYPAANCVRLLNPLSQDLSVLRQTLIFGGLETISRNVNRRRADLQLFEFGNCYYFHAEKKCADIIPGVSSSRDPEVIKHVLDAYSEDYHLGLWITGKRVSGSWAHPDEDQTFYVLKAQVMNILQRLGVPFGAIVFKDGQNDLFAKSILIENRGGKVIAQRPSASPNCPSSPPSAATSPCWSTRAWSSRRSRPSPTRPSASSCAKCVSSMSMRARTCRPARSPMPSTSSCRTRPRLSTTAPSMPSCRNSSRTSPSNSVQNCVDFLEISKYRNNIITKKN